MFDIIQIPWFQSPIVFEIYAIKFISNSDGTEAFDFIQGKTHQMQSGLQSIPPIPPFLRLSHLSGKLVKGKSVN